MKDFKPLLKNRKFVALWVSQLTSQLTIHVMNFLLLVKLFDATGSTIATSLLWVSYSIPALLIGPIAAASTDLLDKRKTLAITNFAQSILIFTYAFISSGTSQFLLYGVAMSYSFINQFYVPAEMAALPSVVKKKNYAYANGLFFITQQTAVIIGFAIAGLLLRVLGFTFSLYVCSTFLFIAFLSVISLPRLKPKDKLPEDFEGAFFEFFKRIYDGYKYIKNHRSILMPFLLLLGIQITLAIVIVNVPLVALSVLKIPLDLSGIFIVVPSGIGAAIGAVTVPKLLRKGVRKLSLIQKALSLASANIILLAFFVPTFSIVYRLIFAAVIFVILGISFVSIAVPAQTFLQEKTSQDMRGRVFGNFWFLVTVATIIPILASGAISELLGIRTLLTGLVILIVVTLVLMKRNAEKFVRNGFRM